MNIGNDVLLRMGGTRQDWRYRVIRSRKSRENRYVEKKENEKKRTKKLLNTKLQFEQDLK